MSSGRRRIFTLKNKRHMPKWLAFLAACLVRLWTWTFRVEVVDPHGFLNPERTGGRIVAIWHNRLLFAAPLSPSWLRRNSSVLISASRDGEYVSTFIHFFDVGVIRGSSSRGGVKAFLEMMDVLRRPNQTIVLTIDGPRGPMYQPHHGIIGLAQKSGVPIVPVSINTRCRWTLKSWDRMQIPWPFSKVRFVFGQPFSVEDDSDMEEKLEHLRRELMDITED